MITKSRACEKSISVEEVLDKYSAVLSQNYTKQEQELLDNLFFQVKTLKKELAFFKHQLSPENIDNFIIQKRREKEKERQLLENRWRQCNQAFKALQEEQKQLIHQQKEDAFDVKNLQKKIEQFRNQIELAKSKAQNPKNKKQVHFLTQLNQNYQSPYKASNTQLLKPKKQKKNLLCQNSSIGMLSSKYKLNRCHLKLNAQINTNLADTTESSRFEHSFNNQKRQNQKNYQPNTERKNNLQQFLNDPNVRLKVFKIIKHQL